MFLQVSFMAMQIKLIVVVVVVVAVVVALKPYHVKLKVIKKIELTVLRVTDKSSL